MDEPDYSRLMEECIDIAYRGNNDNVFPMVGCIILDRNYQRISEGWRRRIEGTSATLHAERDAINKAKDSNAELIGGTLICTLEPCKTPRDIAETRGFRIKHIFTACSNLIVDSGIARVVYASEDPSGVGGIANLKARGVETIHLEHISKRVQRILHDDPQSERRRRRETRRSY